MRVIFVLALFISAAARLDAQAAGPVLLEACNETPFGIGVAVAYRDTPADRRMARGWFQIPAGDCLEGNLGEIAGEELWIGAVSGEWRWPATETPEERFCTPAMTFFERARSEACFDDERLTGFEAVAIEPFRAGWDRVQVRYSCDDFDERHAALCRQTREARDGLAEPVRSLEVCNTWPVEAEIAVGAATEFAGFESTGWQTIPPTLCQVVYLGFPANNEVWFVSRRAGETREAHANEGRLCVAAGGYTATGSREGLLDAAQCPADAPIAAAAQRARFGPSVARFQDFVPRN